MAIEKYDLKMSLTQAQFSNVPQEKHKDCFTVPATWTEAWNHPCPFPIKLWRDAIQKELEKMESNKVYRKCNKSDPPAGRKPIKWVFDMKMVTFVLVLWPRGFLPGPWIRLSPSVLTSGQ